MPSVNSQAVTAGTHAAVPASVRGAACTCFKLRSLARRVTQLYDQTLSPSGLKVTQFSVLGHARRKEGAAAPTVSELALALFTDRTTLTRNLKLLVDAGLLKIGSGADARSKAVCVTPKGEQAWQDARPLWKAAQVRMRELTGGEQLEALHHMIETILPKLDDAEPTEA